MADNRNRLRSQWRFARVMTEHLAGDEVGKSDDTGEYQEERGIAIHGNDKNNGGKMMKGENGG